MTAKPDRDRQLLHQGSRLEKLLEHRARLTILILLARHEEMNFRRLKDLLEETDGNLGAHLKRLEDADLIQVRKTFEKRKPVSWYRLEDNGRITLDRHLQAMKAMASGLDP
ncbi:MAG: transcriptional regulator [Planctomycetota bacterium]